jgi:type II restriction/modification system DNA methylase subunit YeeA
MDTAALKTFAIRTRKDLIAQVARRLDGVLPADSDARREAPAAMAELDREIARTSRAAVIDRVAYTWFNRFTALRYMDARGYLAPRVVSPADGETRPEILSQAVQGILPDHLRKEVAAQVRDLIEGRAPSREPQVEAYRRLVVASCNALHGLMPFLFERIADYTELLMPNELLAETGWVAELRAVMTPEACEDVEILGWLYQFYISEKKDEVFGRPSGQKIKPEEIPAATQLFTPHWIVRYLVENSLGRLWLLNNPDSQLAAKMDYYIAPEEPETDFLRIGSPEEIRVCDPAAGSGHMLTYAFDLLYEIYLERGYTPRDIPGLILTHNLTGVEIDDRAGGLAAFALMMKAANQLGKRRFLQMEARPDVVVLEDVSIRLADFNSLLTALGYDLNVDRVAAGLKTVPLALSGLWSQVSAYLKRAEGSGFEDAHEEAATLFASGLADEIGLFDEAANNPFLVNQLKELRTALVAIAEKDSKQRDRTKLEREFRKRTGSPRLADRVTRIGSDYRSHKNDTTYRMELDALLDRVEEAVRHPEALSKLKGIVDRLNAAVDLHAPLWATVLQFEQAKNFGSLIVPKVAEAAEVLEEVRAADLDNDLMLTGTRDRVVAVLRMAEALAPRYHVVVANPPYMGWGGMNANLQDFAKLRYADSKSDLFSMFMERTLANALHNGFVGMINMQAWMFLSSFEKLRMKITSKATIISMAHLGERGFDTIGGAVVSTTAFILENVADKEKRGDFLRLVSGRSEKEKSEHALRMISTPSCNGRYRVRTADILKIPGSPVAYWIREFSIFEQDKVSENWLSGGRLKTHDGPKYIRFMWEVDYRSTRWKRVAKGGEFRRFFGNEDSVADWSEDALDFYRKKGGLPPEKFWGKEGISWTKITTSSPSFRLNGPLTEYDSASPTILPCDDKVSIQPTLGFLNTKVSTYLLDALNPTMNFQVADVLSLPQVRLPEEDENRIDETVNILTALARSDWDAFETSWDFTTLPLLSPDHRSGTLEATYARLRAHWAGMTAEMQRLEEENNRIFIDAYGLQDELTPEVPIEEITLTCNPAYSIKGDMSDVTREARLRERTVKEFISYAIGCMFGRYSLDAPGLILANQGDTLQDYLARIPDPTFTPDADNIIPILGDDRFEDDAYGRFRTFLSLTFGQDRLDENLAFVREAIGESVRDYLAKRFFDDHVTRYKKRPIYWLVSSPKGAFQALIYMHRYNPDTLNTVLTRYVRPLRDRLEAAVRAAEGELITASASATQRNKAQKEIDRLNKQITELTDWERDHLYPMALQRIQIDLDDGVKRNYPLFGGVMKPVKGIASDE